MLLPSPELSRIDFQRKPTTTKHTCLNDRETEAQKSAGLLEHVLVMFFSQLVNIPPLSSI